MKRTRLFGLSLLSVSVLALASCGDAAEEDTSATTSATAEAGNDTEVEQDAEVITFSDAVVRASAEDNPMTAIFGELRNNTGEEVTITGFTADVAAESYEIHETVDGVMQEKTGGITLSPGKPHELEPGADHFMMMGLAEPVAAGDVVSLTLELADGSTVDLGEVPVRTIAAGDEDYGDLDGQGHGGHGHDDTDDGMENEH